MIGDESDDRMLRSVTQELDWDPKISGHTVAVRRTAERSLSPAGSTATASVSRRCARPSACTEFAW